MERKFNAKLLALFLLIGAVICAVFAYFAINSFSNTTAQAEDNTYISAPEKNVSSGGLTAEQTGDEITAPEIEAKATKTTLASSAISITIDTDQLSMEAPYPWFTVHFSKIYDFEYVDWQVTDGTGSFTITTDTTNDWINKNSDGSATAGPEGTVNRRGTINVKLTLHGSPTYNDFTYSTTLTCRGCTPDLTIKSKSGGFYVPYGSTLEFYITTMYLWDYDTALHWSSSGRFSYMTESNDHYNAVFTPGADRVNTITVTYDGDMENEPASYSVTVYAESPYYSMSKTSIDIGIYDVTRITFSNVFNYTKIKYSLEEDGSGGDAIITTGYTASINNASANSGYTDEVEWQGLARGTITLRVVLSGSPTFNDYEFYSPTTITINGAVPNMSIGVFRGDSFDVAVGEVLTLEAQSTSIDIDYSKFTWRIVNGTGSATLAWNEYTNDIPGLTGVSAGTVTVYLKFLGDTIYAPSTSEVSKTITIKAYAQTFTISGNSTVVYGSTLQLSASTTTYGTVTWSSSNTSIATVSSSGLVTPKKVGSTTITLYAAGNASYSEKTVYKQITVQRKAIAIPTLTKGAGVHANATVASQSATTYYNGDAQHFTISSTANITFGTPSTGTTRNGTDFYATSVGSHTVSMSIDSNKYCWGTSNNGNDTANKTLTIDISKGNQTPSISGGNTVEVNKTLQLTTNGHGTITWSVATKSGGGAATISSNGLLSATAAGVVTVTVSAAGDTNYNSGTNTLDVTISKATNSVTITGATSVVYDSTITLQGSGTGTLSWTSSDPSVATVSSIGVVTPVKAGTVTITLTANGNASYNSGTATHPVTVQRKAVAVPTLTNGAGVHSSATASAQAATTTYNGNAQHFTLSAEPAEVTFGVPTAGATLSGTDFYATAGGTYKVSMSIDSNKYCWGSTNGGTDVKEKTLTLTINQAGQTVTISGDTTVVYGSTLSLTGTGVGQLTWTSSDPSIAAVSSSGVVTPVKAGKVTITLTADGNANYDSGTATQNVTVLRKAVEAPTLSLGTGAASTATVSEQTATTNYNGSEQHFTLSAVPEEITFGVPTAGATLSGSDFYATAGGTYKVLMSIDGNKYCWGSTDGGENTASKTLTLIINKTALSLTLTYTTVTFGTNSDEPTLQGNSGDGTPTYTVAPGTGIASIDASTGVLTPTKAGTVSVTVSVPETDNYADGSITVTITIGAKDISYTDITAPADQTYTGLELTPALTIKNGTVTLVNGTDYTLEYSDNVNAGRATVTITGAGNYTGTTSVNFTINRASITPTLSYGSVVYGTDSDEPTVGGNISNGEVSFTVEAGTGNASIDAETGVLTPITAGKVSVTVTIAETDNYLAGSKTITVTIGKLLPTATVSVLDGYYYVGDKLESVTLSANGQGTVAWNNSDTIITSTSGSYDWTFTPTDTDNYSVLTGTLEVTAYYKVTGITVSGANTSYKAYDTFDTTGMTVTASYAAGKLNTEITSGYSIIYPTKGLTHFVLSDDGEDVTISYTESGITVTAPVTISIIAKEYNMKGVTLEGLTVDYDGEYHKLTITGDLPDGVELVGFTYNDEESALGVKTAGTYTVKAVFKIDDPDNYKMPKLSATLVIEKATPTVVGVELVAGKYYKGAALSSVHLSYDEDNTSPEGSIDWVDGAIKLGSANDGRYQWVFTPNDSTNYKTVEGWLEITNLQAKVEEIEVINPKTDYIAYESFVTDGVKVLVTYLDETTAEVDLSDCTLLYPDTTRNHFLAGDENITVWYGNVSTTVNVTVSKKAVDVTGITFAHKLNEVYDNSLKSIIAENLPDGVEIAYYTYNGETLEGVKDVGTYEVKVYFYVTIDPDNVAVPEPMTATLKIAQGTPDISVEVDYSYRYPAGSTLNDVKLKYECDVAGTLSWTVGSLELEDDGEYEWTFKPTDTKNYKTVKGTLTVEIFYEVNSIQVTVNKSEFEAYDKLGKTDITVKAIFTNKAPATVDGWTVTYPNGGDCFLVSDTGKDVIINYNDAEYIIKVTVNKKNVDMSGVTFDDKLNEVYDGSLKSVVAEDLPDGVEVDHYVYNDQTASGVRDAGDYDVTVYFKVTDNNLTIETESKTAQLHVEKADSVLTFTGDTEFTYSGEAVTITSGASVNNSEQTDFGYTNNTFLNVSDSGVMTVTVAASKNYKETSIEVPVTVNPAVLTLTWAGGNATYDGYSHSAELTVVSGAANKDKEDITTENLADLITVSYTGNDPDRKLKGNYTVTLESFPESGLYANYTYVITNNPYTFTITDGVLNITFSGDSVEYDGELHTLTATGLPAEEEMTVTYYYNGDVFTGAIDAGTYEVEAQFVCLTDNFTAPAPMTATLTITAKSISGCDVDGVDEQHVYDGKLYKPENVTVKLEVNGSEVTLEKGTDFEVTSTGSSASAGTTGKIVITGKGNYGGSVELTYSIVPRELGIEWNEGDYSYNGNPQGVTAQLTNVVSGEEVNVEITYTSATGYSSTTKPTDAGAYTATANLDSPYGNYTFTEQSITFEIKMADVEVELQYPEDFDSANIYGGMAMPNVTAVATTEGGDEVEGKFTWAKTSFVFGTDVYGWTFEPDSHNYNVKQGTESFNVREAKITTLTVAWVDGEQPPVYTSTKLDAIRNYIVVTGTLENGIAIDIAGYTLTCDGFAGQAPTKPGTYTLKATFNGKSDTISVKYDAVECKELIIEAANGKEIKTDYFVFDKFDTTTLKVTATFTDGSTQTLTDTEYTIVYVTDGSETLLMGDTYVKVNYNGTEKPIYVTVSKKPYDTSNWSFAENKNSTYNGNVQSYKIEGVGDDFYVEYEYFKKSSGNTWVKLDSKDEVKNAGEYKIVATILPIGDISDNYSYPERLESLFTIAKQTPDIGKPSIGGNLSAGTKLSELKLLGELDGIEGTFVWEDEDQVLEEGVNQCAYIFIPTDSENYNRKRGVIEIPIGNATKPGDETAGSGISTGALAAILVAVAVVAVVSIVALSVALKKKPSADSDGFYDDVTPEDLM